jgi:hypothetical protein
MNKSKNIQVTVNIQDLTEELIVGESWIVQGDDAQHSGAHAVELGSHSDVVVPPGKLSGCTSMSRTVTAKNRNLHRFPVKRELAIPLKRFSQRTWKDRRASNYEIVMTTMIINEAQILTWKRPSSRGAANA